MVTLGKLNMTEFAYSGIGLNPHYGTPVNPNGKTVAHVPGGSSSGCGVAVAAKLLPCAIGSDTGGSVRIPASYNGVVGYKTSLGRIDTTGVVALARSYDTVGPLARSVEDCILLDRALRGAIGAELLRADLAGADAAGPDQSRHRRPRGCGRGEFRAVARGAGGCRRHDPAGEGRRRSTRWSR